MNRQLENLKRLILEVDEIPESEVLFAGANLIISGDQNREKRETDILVVTNNPKQISWFIFQLKDIFSDRIDYMNKYCFYTSIGNLLNRAISEGKSLKEQLIYILENINSERNFQLT